MKKLTSLLLAIGVFCATAFTASAQAPLQYRVDDVADLLAITLYGSDAKVTAWVGGNTTRDDGLGGMFYYDGNSSAATNVYAVFKPTNNAGRWFKLPTAVAWQNDAVTVGVDSTYGWKFLRGTGQTNFFGIGADNNIAYLQTFNGKNLHINNQGNTTVLNQTAGNVGIGVANPGAKLAVGAETLEYAPLVGIRASRNGVEFGHPAAGYGSTIGGEQSSGFPFVAFNAGAGTTADTYKTLGQLGSVIKNNAGDLIIGSLTSANADNQSVTERIRVGGGGAFKVTGTAQVTGNITNDTLTASLPVWSSASKVLVSQSVAASKTALGIQAGTTITTADNTVTNTFATAFSSAPVVVTTPTGAAGTTCLTNAVISVSTTGFVYNCGVPSVTIQWVAIGAP